MDGVFNVTSLTKSELIAKDIKLRIFQNHILPGDRLNERKVAVDYSVARGTARAALGRLYADGTLRSIPSVGYLVNWQKTDRLLAEADHIVPRLKVYRSQHSSLYRKQGPIKIIKVNKSLGKFLHLPLGTELLKISVIRSNGPESSDISSATYYIPRNIPFDVYEYKKGDHQVLSLLNKESAPITSMFSNIQLIAANEEMAETVHVPKGETLLKRESIFKDDQGSPICFVREIRKPDSSACIAPNENIFKKVGGFLG
jgi:DNA-binding GntR family transcriptional regulator